MKKTLVITFLFLNILNLFSADSWTQYTTENGLADNSIRCIKVDNSNIKWICTDNGLVKYENSQFSTFTVKEEMGGNNFYDLKFDSKGNLLIGSEGYLLIFDRNNWQFKKLNKAYTVTSVGIDSKDSIWISTYGGGEIFKLKDTIWTGYPMNDNFSDCMVIDPKDNKWVGNLVGVAKLNSENELKTFSKSEGIGSSIQSICIDNNGNIWCGTYSTGVVMYDGNSWKSFSKTDGLGGLSVTSVFVDKNNTVWAGHEDGVSKYDGTKWTNLSYNELKTVTAICVDAEGNKWFGTHMNGLFKYNEEKISSGIANTSVNTINVYPNPVHDNLFFTEKFENITLTDPSGKVFQLKQTGNYINLEGFAPGIYLLKGATKKGNKTARFIKN